MMSDPLEKEAYRYTYRDYKEWELKPRERFELIDGVAYAMSAPNTRHQRIVTTLITEFASFLKDKPCEVIVSPFDVRLFYEEDESDDTVVQPDLIVVCDPAKLGEEGCRGAPDLAVEVLSPSNSAIEMERKRLLYRDAGVREYWVVDGEDRIISVYHLADGEYGVRTYRVQDSVRSEVLKGFALPLAALFGDAS
jgi:Uma2 family endonuclease